MDRRDVSLAIVFLVVLIDMLGFGIVMPVLPALLEDLTGKAAGSAAVDAGWLMMSYAAMQFIFAPVIGNLSDRFGRRPVLLASMLGYAVNYALMAVAPTLFWLFVGRMLAGIAGASFSTAYAYIADISPPEKRAANFGLIGMAFGLGFIFGPAIGGLMGEFGPRVPFYAAAALALANAALGYLLLRESLAPEKRRPFALWQSNAVSALVALGRQSRTVVWHAFALFLWMTAHGVYPAIWAFFTVAAFGFSEGMVGLSLAVVGLMSVLVQGIVIRWAVPRIGEAWAVVTGVLSMATGASLYLLIDQGWMVFLVIPVGALQGFVQPSINALMSRAIDESSQGELQGAVTSLNSLSVMVGPPVFAATLALFTGPDAPMVLPGAPFGLAALIALATLIPFALALRSAPVSARPVATGVTH